MKHVHDAIIVPLEWAVAFISKIKSLKELNAALEPEVDARKSEVVELVEPKKSSSPELFDKQDSIGDKAGSQEADAHPKRQLMVYQVSEAVFEFEHRLTFPVRSTKRQILPSARTESSG